MRSTIILALSIVGVLAGFGIYFWMQPKLAPRNASARSVTTAPADLKQSDRSTASVVGAGEDVWVKTYDEKTGRLAFQLRAARYDPRPDGNSVDVMRPQAELFMGEETDLRVLRIEGETGRVVMPTDAAQRGDIRAQTGAPRRGELKGVRISMFDAADMSRPILVCRVNNVSFDNDTFRIATEGFTDGSGAPVPADEVPVEVRGDEYDFDGRGLIIRWDGMDRRLALLEIAHGERLVVKSEEAIQSVDGSDTPAPKPAARTKRPAETAAPQKEASAESAVVYRASFADAVRVTQDQHTLAQADQMLIDFLGTTSAGVAPPKSSREPKPHPTAPASSPEAKPAKTSSRGPIVVHWTGKLRIAPREGTAARPLAGKFDVALHGESQPVQLNVRGAGVTCASLEHLSADDSARFANSNAFPLIVMTDSSGTRLTTPSVEFSGAQGSALMKGPSTGVFPVRDESGDASQLAMLSWQDTCRITFGGAARDDLAVERAELHGKVHLDHPQLMLGSETLDVQFAERHQTREPSLKQVTAAGDVQAIITDAQDQKRKITCERLSLTAEQTPQGKTFVRSMNADGRVHAFDDEQQLRAGHLELKLGAVPASTTVAASAPARGGALANSDVQVESLLAQQEVQIESRDGMKAAGEQLRMSGVGEEQEIVLLGQPAASVSDGTNSLSAQHISMKPAVDTVSVRGPGRMHGVESGRESEKPRTIDVEWRSGLDASGHDNRIEINGEVRAVTTEGDGSSQKASADKLVLVLGDAGATQPAAAPATQPGIAQANPLRGKDIQSLTFDGNTHIELSMTEPDTPGRRLVDLLAPKATFDAAARRFVVPSGGQLLVRDDMPADAKPAEVPQAPFAELRGATAFQWQKELVFDEAQNRATMSDNVVIVHQDPGDNAAQFRLLANEVVADLVPGGVAQRPGGAPEFRVKRLIADGDVRFSSRQIQFEAGTLEYDPSTSTLVARGTDRNPAQLFDESGVSKGSFEELFYNTTTEQIRLKNPQAQIRR